MDDSKTTATVEGDASTKEAEKAASAVPAAVSTESKGDSAEAGAESTGGNEQQDAKIGAAEGGEAAEDAGAAAQPSQNNLIINYLPSHVTEIELRNMFAVHGDLAHVKVVYDRATGKSMGYGFVMFTTDEAAAAAIAAINGMAIDRKRIKVSVARPSSKDIKNSKLYVTNLPDHFSQDQVVEVFQQYGKIIECRTLVDPKTTISRCTAFVQFDTRREAKDALKFMNGHSLPGAKKGLLVKFAEDHHRRLQRQEQGQNGKGRGGMEGSHMGGGNQYGHHNHQGHQGKGKGGRKGRGGGGGRGGGMYRGNGPGMGGRHGIGHMGPAGYLPPTMGMQAPPDAAAMGQTMMGRYGMQVPSGNPAAAYNVAHMSHQNYNMMHLNNAMGMMNMNSGSSMGSGGGGGGQQQQGGAGGRTDGSEGAPPQGSPGQQGGPFGPMPGVGVGGQRSSMMRGGMVIGGDQGGVPPPPPQGGVGMPQMLSPTGYGSAGAGIGYASNGDMKNASNLRGGGGPVSSVKHHQQQPGGDRGSLEQQANNHGQPFVLRGV